MKQIIPFNKEIAFKTMIGEIQSISLEHTLKIKDDNNIKGDFIVSGSYKMTEASTIAEEFSYKIPVDIYIDEEYDLEDAVIDIDDFKYSIINDDTLDVKIDLLLDKMELVKTERKISKEEEVIQAHLDKDYLKLKSETLPKEEQKEEVLEESKEEKELVLDRNDIEKEEKESILERKNKENKEEIMTTTIEEDVIDAVEIPIETKNTEVKEKVESLFNKFSDEEDSYSTYKVYIVRENDNLESIIEKYNISLDELREYNNVDDLKLNDKLIIPCHNENA